jgi:hypothetical protein
MKSAALKDTTTQISYYGVFCEQWIVVYLFKNFSNIMDE